MVRAVILIAVGIFAGSLPSTTLAAPRIGHITGIGGVFVTSKNPKALAKWYRDVLGIKMEEWGVPSCAMTRQIIRRWRFGTLCPTTARRSHRRIVSS